MKRMKGRRLIAFLMAFIMTLSVVFQGDYVIGGLGNVRAEESSLIDLSDGNGAVSISAKALTNTKYTGSEITYSESDITVKYNGSKLTSGTDYTVSYENNVNAGKNTASIVITGTGAYTGTLTKSFTIKVKSIADTDVYIGVKGDTNYNLSNCKNQYFDYVAGGPEPEVYIMGATDYLTLGTDYTVSHFAGDDNCSGTSDNPSGVTITLTNSNYTFSGSKTEVEAYYGVKPSSTSNLTVKLDGVQYKCTGSAIKPGVTVTDSANGKTLSVKDGEYTVEYADNIEPGTAKVTITPDSNKYTGEPIVKTFTILDSSAEVYDISEAKATVNETYVYDGTAKEPVPTLTYNGNALVEGTDFEITGYSNNTNATTTKSRASINITGINSYSGTTTVKFDISPRDISNATATSTDTTYKVNNSTSIYNPPTVTVVDNGLSKTLKETTDYNLDYSDYINNKHAVGEYTVTVKGVGNYTGSITTKFKVTPMDISSATVTANSAEYTGSPVTTTISSVVINSTTLTEGTDFEISDYENNTNLGKTAKVIITGKGSYTGTATGTFEIYTNKISIEDVTITGIGDEAYTGTQIMPEPVLTYDEKTLVKGEDYELSYGTNLTPGTNAGSVTITGKNDYAGSIVKTFDITKRSLGDVTAILNKDTYDYTGSAVQLDVTVKLGDKTLVEGTDYKFTSTYTDTGTYNVYITYVYGSEYYTGSTKVGIITITSPSGDMANLTYEDIPDQYYTGSNIVPTLVIKNGDYTLKEETDYTVTKRNNNLNAGTSTIEIEGAGSYKGTKTLSFKILPVDLSDCTVEDIPDQEYDGGDEIMPSVTVYNGSVKMLSTYYNLEYVNNVNASDKAAVVITANSSNFTGSKTVYFTITPINIFSGNRVSVTDARVSQEYTGSAIKPAIEVKATISGTTNILTLDEDYTVEYGENTEIGSDAYVKVTGINNYTGTSTMSFDITKKQIQNCTIESIPNQLWTGSQITPEVTIKNGDITLVKDTDYSLAYSNNKDEGEATVTITGKGDYYAGTTTKTFVITKEIIDISNGEKLQVTGLTTQTYNFGQAITPEFNVTYDGVALVRNQDYTYSFSDNKNVGTAKLTIQGNGSYSGSKTFTFDITARSMSDLTLSLSKASYEYTGSAITPELKSIDLDGVAKITAFDDFTVSCTDNTNVGTATVTVTAKAGTNLTGSVSKEFTITKKDISKATVTASDSTYEGIELTPEVTVTLSDGTTVPAAEYDVTYENNVKVGTATVVVTAKTDSNYTGSCSGTFNIGASIEQAKISGISEQATYTGSDITFADLSVTLGDTTLTSEDYTVSYTNNINVSTDTSKAKLTITGKGSYVGTVECEFTIVPKSIEGCTVEDIATQLYTESAITPSVTVKDGSKTLTADTDYTLTYANNTAVTDEATVTIAGTGNYTGSITKKFAIKKQVIDISSAVVTVSDAGPFTYSGQEITPAVTVTLNKATLAADNYTVSYTSNVNAGTAEVTVTGKGDYTGSASTTFTIEQLDVSAGELVLEKTGYEYTGTQVKPAITGITVGTSTIELGSNFDVTYSDNVNVGTAKVTVTAKTGTNFTGSLSENYTISAINISTATVTVSDQTYTGSALTPSVTVVLGDTKLTAVTDYTVAYTNNTNVGTAKVTITGTGNYTGTVNSQFAISEKSLTSATVTVSDQTYTGAELAPAVTVILGGVTLTASDYDVTYGNNTDKGVATVTVTGKNNYKGTATGSFNIVAMDISKCDIADVASVVYSGAAQTPEITVKNGDVTLAKGTDYTVAYSNNTNATTSTNRAKIVVTGYGNYTGESTVYFDITPKSIDSAVVTGVSTDTAYTGENISLSGYELTCDETKLVENTDYAVSYSGNKEVGKASITFTAMGNYTGSKTVSFNITAANITDCQIGAVSGQKYTGKEVKPSVTIKNGNVTLVEDEDYELSYSNNIDVTDKAVVAIKGKGNYTGETEIYFTISREVVNISGATVSPIAAYTYNFGKEITPEVTVTMDGTTLVLDQDYTVSYEDNVNAGTAKVKITGQGYYSDTKTVTFTISAYDVSKGTLNLQSSELGYTGSELTPVVKDITFTDGNSITDLTQFTTTCKNNTNVGTGTVTLKAIAGGNFTGSVSADFTISADSIDSAVVTVDDAVYQGTALTPAVKVVCGGNVLAAGTDYKVSYENNINVGKGTVKVTGCGNYSGSVTKEFSITARTIADAQVDVSDVTYTGTELTPTVKVSIGSTVLTLDKDYTVSYDDNQNAGTAKVTVTGTGNYKDSVGQSFKIEKKSLEKATVSTAKSVTYTGAELKPSVTVTLDDAELTLGVDYEVAYTNNIDATTTDSAANIVVTGKGNYQGSVKTTFAILPRNIEDAEVSGYSESVEYTGSNVEFSGITVSEGTEVLVNGVDYTISYTGNTAVTENGSTYFVVTGKGNYSGSRKISFTITSKNIQDCDISEIGSQKWTGEEVKPEVVVKNGQTVLTTADYDVTYDNNINETSADSLAKAIITGKGNYSGTVTKTFVIAKQLVDISKATVSDIADAQYDFGREITPEITVTLSGTKLTLNEDYVVRYSDNVEAGTATAEIIGIGGYTKSLTKTFKINPVSIADADVTLKNNTFTYTGSAITPAVVKLTITNNGVTETLEDLSSFGISYSDNVAAGKATVTVSAADSKNFTGEAKGSFDINAASITGAVVQVSECEYTGSAVVPEVKVTLGEVVLEKNVDYTVSASNNVDATSAAQLTVTGKGNYQGTISEAFEIGAKSVEDGQCTIEDKEYTGSEIKPGVTVTVGGKTLTENKDYTVNYTNNIEVSTSDSKATAVITGTGNYTGKLNVSFTITAKTLTAENVEDIDAVEYTGSAVTPALTVKNGSVTLVSGRDYEVTYSNNTAKTTSAKAIVKGIGNYTGTVTKTFEICSTSIAGATVNGVPDSTEYTGDSISFDSIEVYFEGKLLTKGVDYTVSYTNNVNVTTESTSAYVTIQGIDNYGGQVKVPFAITARDIKNCTVGAIEGQTYTGEYICPDVTIKDGSRILEKGTDYTLSYDNNKEISSSAKVIITGAGNYTGSVSTAFTIAKEVLDISKATISDIEDQYYNFGEDVVPGVVVTLGTKTLTKDEDYSVSYSRNTSVGIATVTVKGINQNKGEVSKTFNIVPIDITDAKITLATNSYKYTGDEITAEVSSIAVNRAGKTITVDSMDSFTITCKNNVQVGKATLTVTAVEDSGFTGSSSVNYSIVAADVSDATVSISDCTYNGKAQEPDCTVTSGGRKLTLGEDFTVKYSDNVNASETAKAVITGCGNYTGTINQTFQIMPKKISQAELTVSDVEYTGKALTPSVTVKLDNTTLVSGTDYTVSYKDNINATTGSAKAVATVTGTGNYTGTVDAEFAIAPKDISTLTVEDIATVVYGGSEVKPEVVVKNGTTKLVSGTDYTVSYEDNNQVTSSAKAIISGCGNYTGSVTKTFAISSYSISKAEVGGVDSAVIYTGEDITFDNITVTIDGNALDKDTDYTVTYKNNKNVTSDDALAQVIITGCGNYAGSVTKTFAINAKNIARCSVDPVGGQKYSGSAITPEVVVRDGSVILTKGTDYTVAYNNNTVVTNAAEITITGNGNYKGTINTVFTIAKEVLDISKAVISTPADSQYDFGAEIKPSVTVTLAGKTLTEGTDYELVYVNNIKPGTASVIAKGINANSGQVEASFEIAAIDISKAVVTLDNNSYEYVGSAITPDVVMVEVTAGDKTEALTALDAFNISYSDNVNVGSARVTVTAKAGEGFSGSATAEFDITKVSLSDAAVVVENSSYTGEPQTPKYTVTLNGKKLTSGTDFTAEFSNNTNVGSKALLTVKGAGNYEGTAVGYFSISSRDITSATVTASDSTYTGKEITPKVVVTLGDEILNADIDYTVSYSNNVNATTGKTKAQVTVTGCGNYTGTVYGSFDIAAKDISKAQISTVENQKYTGSEVKPEITVTLEGKELSLGTDYTVSYDNNIEAQTKAQITVTAKGNYTGTLTTTFTIEKNSLSDAQVTGISEKVVYSGKDIEFDDLLVVKDGVTLIEDEDYTVVYEDNKNVTDKATVKIVGCGNYTGSIEKTFAITAKDISDCDVDAISGQLYTGKEITPTIVVRDSGVALDAENYTVTYSNNSAVTTDSSKAEAVITGTGNYTGTKTVQFTISEKLRDISKAKISSVADQYYNLGNAVKPTVTVTLDGTALTEGTDYQLIYSNNYDEGTATVTVQGVNDNTGSVSAEFEIVPLDITDAVITLEAYSFLYTGSTVKPDITSLTVRRDGKNCAVTDFDGLEIEYTNNSAVGTGKVTITGISGEGYTGSVSKNFTITSANLENATIKIAGGEYTGKSVEPDYTVTIAGKTLTAGADYQAVFSNNISAGSQATLTITGKGNYSGSKSQTFTISPRKINDAVVTVGTARYTGNELTPDVEVVVDGVSLVADRDYELSYSDNVSVTTAENKAVVTVAGKGNYQGTVTEEFDISPREISLTTVQDVESAVYTGKAVEPELTISDGTRKLVAGKDYTVSYSDNNSVTETAVAVITGKGNYTGQTTKTFAIKAADISSGEVTGVKDSVTYTGQAVTFSRIKVTLNGETLTNGIDYVITYMSNKDVTSKASVIVTGKGNYSGSITKTFAITSKSITDDDMYVSEIPGQVYTGYALEPEITVAYGNITLTENVDYEVSYSNNVNATTADSLAVATITGKGNYAGTVTREFSISSNAKNIASAKVGAIDSQVFAKTYIKPEVSVSYGDDKLTEGVDYKVSYMNNYNAGTATVYITGFGDYVGTKTATFNITKKDISGFVIALEGDNYTYTGKSITPDIDSVTGEDIVLDDDEIAQLVVKYSNNVNAGTATVSATASNGSNYTGTLNAKFNIDKASIADATVTAEDVEYTGAEVTPNVTVTVNGVVLNDNDYEVSYSNNVQVGTAEVTVTGKNNYTGTVTGKFKVTQKSLKGCTVSYDSYAEYTGSAVTPAVTVKVGAKTLVLGEDYTVGYENNTETTTKAKIVIIGKGNYKDSVTKYFTIGGGSIADATVSGIENKQFTGHEITQDISVVFEGRTLTQGTDYTVTYANNLHAGTATVTITGKGNYTDSVKKSFVINRVDVSKTATITGIKSEGTYNGSAFKFDNIGITWNGFVLAEGTDYNVTYKNNSKITMNKTSKASCTVTFTGDYKGSVTKSFRIKAFDISKATASAISNKTYTGKAITPAVTVKIDKTVINSSEYQVSYSNNVKPGVATITITGLNNFYGTLKVNFNILPAAVTGLKYTASTTNSVSVSWSAVTGATGYEVYRYDTAKKSYVKVGTTTGTAYTVKSLASATGYTIGVKAYYKTSAGKYLYGEQKTTATATKPDKVTGFKAASKTDTRINLAWTKVNRAEGYKIYKYDSAKKTYVELKTVGSNVNSLQVSGLKASTTYKFKIQSYKKLGSAYLWSDATEISVVTTPAAVKSLKVTARSNTTITLKWSKVASADGYIVYRYSKGKYVKIKTITKKTTVKFVSSNLSAGTTYKYKVVAYKKVGSAKVQNAGTIISSTTSPATPVVTAKKVKTKATLSWRKSKGATGYVIYMSTSKRGKYKKIATVKSAKTTTYTKTGLKKNTTYYFKIRSYKKYKGKLYYSSYSTIRKIVVK